MTTSDNSPARLSVCRRLLFGLASPPLQLTQNAIGLYLNLFLLEAAKLRPLLISVVMFSGRFVDAVSDPLIGYGVSRTRSRFGKCRPWLLASAPLSAVAFFILWLPPQRDWGDGARLAFYLPAYVAFSLAISCYYIPYTTLTMRISASPGDRDSATAFRMAFEMLGILVGPIFFTFIVEPRRASVTCVAAVATTNETQARAAANATRTDTSAEEAAYLISAGAVSTLVLLCGIVGFFGVREIDKSGDSGGEEGAVSESLDGHRVKNSIGHYLGQCRQVVSYRPFLQATLIFITLSLSWHIFQAISILYVTHVMRLGSHVRYCTLVYLLVALAATPAWHMFAARFGKKLALQIGSVGTAACCLLAGLMPGGIVPLFYAMVTAAGVLGANALLLSWATLPDVIQAFYRDRGVRLEAVFYSTFTFANKCAVSLSMAGMNLALDLAGYDRFSCVQPGGLVTALRCLLLAPLPLLSLTVCFAWRLPNTAEAAAAASVPAAIVAANGVAVEVGDKDREDLGTADEEAGCREKLRV